MWIGLAVFLLLLPFASLVGRYVPDTRDAVWLSPGTYISKSLSLWRSSPFLGNEQHEGIVVPMGLASLLFRSAGLAPWAAERLWHGLLLFVGAAGMVLLVDHLRGRRTVIAPLAAALIYVLTPYTFGYGLPTTGAFLPYVLLPWLLLATAWGLGRPGLAGPALFGLTTFLMGGGNGAPQLYALIPVAGYWLWVVAVERSVAPARAVKFALWSAGFFLALNAYWIFLLTGSEVTNALTFSEQPRVINVASSYSETIRGLGFWTFYGGDQFGAWVGPVRTFITNPVLILTRFALPVGALASAWLVRWRWRLFFLLLGIVAVVVMAGIYPVTAPTPLGRLLMDAYLRVPGAAGLRTTFKFAGTLNLGLAVLCGVGLEEALRRVPAPRALARARPFLAPVAAVVILANAFPLWTGRLYDRGRSASPVPGYWTNALAYVDAQVGGDFRAFFAPGTNASFYRWGELHDGLAAATPSISTVEPGVLPVGQRFGSNMAAAIEQIYEGDLRSSQAATLLRYLGAKDVVLQNDLDWVRSRTARPATVQRLAEDGSLKADRTFGRVGQNVVDPASGAGPRLLVEQGLHPVQILTVPDPRPVVRTEGGRPVVVSGDGFGIAGMAEAGLLSGNPPVLYSGAMSASQLQSVLKDQPSFVITDSNRRQVWSFTTVKGNRSYTLPAGFALTSISGGTKEDGSAVGYRLFPGNAASQTVAVYDGVRSVEASGYGSYLQAEPQFRPINAFDGDVSTSWLVGGLTNPVGQWVEVRFVQPRTLSRIDLYAPDLGFGRRVSRARIEFSAGGSVQTNVRAGHTVVPFPLRKTTFVRVRILGVTPSPFPNAVGFSEVAVPGVRANEVIQVPTDLIALARRTPGGDEALRTSPLTYLFDRQRTDALLVRDEEAGIVRRFRLATPRVFDLSGLIHLSNAAPDLSIDRVVSGVQPVSAFSSSRLRDDPNLRASQVLDGDSKTAWIPRRQIGEWLQIGFPARKVGHVVVKAQWFPGRTPITGLRFDFSDGSHVNATPTDLNGGFDVKFNAVETTFVKITITAVNPRAGNRVPPVGIAAVGIPRLTFHAAKPSDRIPCYTGASFTLDGRPIAIGMSGNVGDLLAGKDLRLSSCARRPLALAAGTRTLSARGALEPDRVLLATTDGNVPASTLAVPAARVTSMTGGYDVAVVDATTPFYLVIGQNVAPGWTASIDGRSLGEPMVLDGYSAGWRVDHSGSFVVRVRYAPQRTYVAAILLSLAALVVTVAILVWALVRGLRGRRRASGQEPQAVPM